MPALPANLSTVLVISAIGMPPYASRGLTQTLEPIQLGAQMRRTANGKLVNLAPPQFQKYHSKITGTDQQPPALDGVFPGEAITIDCIEELCVPLGAALSRPAVPGSIRADGNFIFYRPRLDMLVTNFSVDTGEWDATVGWSLECEEV